MHSKKQTNNIYTAWFSLEEADNDLNRFLTYFFTAISQIDSFDKNIGKTALEMLLTPNPISIEAIFTPFINDLSSISKKLVFVLDDYHLIEDLPIHTALNFWLENAPPQIHTVVITREDPPFPLSRMRVRSQLTELRVEDLRFTESESTQFLNEIMGLHLNAESVTLLDRCTEGWIAGLKMAALSMKDRKDVIGFIKHFSGTNRYILDYLLEEVLANQSTEIQQFLLETSLLKRLTAPLCDALLDVEDQSADILAYLERANLFLLPLDDERIWYRYHHLFADLLSARLQQTHTQEELANLHTRAAQWYENNKLAYGAIYHASLIPNDEWVENLIDQNYMDIFQRKDSASIRNWTGELSRELIFRRPQLAIHEANSRAWFGQLDEADLLITEAEKRLKAENKTPETQALFGYMAYVKSRITAMRGDFKQAIHLCLLAQENTPANNQGLLGGIGVMLGYGHFLNGDFIQASQVLHDTILSGKKSGAINTTIGAYCVLARLYAIQGWLYKSYELYREAENFIKKSNGQHRCAMSIVDVGFAEIMYEWNNLEAAQYHIHQGLEFIPLWSKADDIAMAQVVNSKIQRAQGNLLAAEKNIEKGSQVTHSSGVFSESRDAVIVAEVELNIKQENHLAISRWGHFIEERLSSDNPFRFENELIFTALARIRLAEGKLDSAMEILSQLHSNAELEGRGGRLIKIMILQAFALQNMGKSGQAFSIVERALSLAEPEGFVRIFIEEGEPMKRMLDQWLDQAVSSHLKIFATHLAAQFDSQSKEELDRHLKTTLDGILIEPLSQREIEVLCLIAFGKTNKEISVDLVVSPGTIKAHTSSIYRKLDVANRTEAVARARDLGILS